jgi:hypothetical protein
MRLGGGNDAVLSSSSTHSLAHRRWVPRRAPKIPNSVDEIRNHRPSNSPDLSPIRYESRPLQATYAPVQASAQPQTRRKVNPPGPTNPAIASAITVSESLRHLTMRLSDAGLRRRPTKLIYPHHRLPPWLNEDAPRDRSNRLLADGPCPPITWAPRSMSVRQYKQDLPKNRVHN